VRSTILLFYLYPPRMALVALFCAYARTAAAFFHSSAPSGISTTAFQFRNEGCAAGLVRPTLTFLLWLLFVCGSPDLRCTTLRTCTAATATRPLAHYTRFGWGATHRMLTHCYHACTYSDYAVATSSLYLPAPSAPSAFLRHAVDSGAVPPVTPSSPRHPQTAYLLTWDHIPKQTPLPFGRDAGCAFHLSA